MKILSDLFECDLDVEILGIEDDSRKIKDGYIFVATKGFNVDHFDYIDDAIANGAIAIVADRKVNCSVPVFVVDNIDDYYFELCSKFYDVNFDEFEFIGITGTDGKTTTASVITELLEDVERCCYIGTNGVRIGDELLSTNNTTPCVSELFNYLKFAKKRKCKVVVIEVSSESLLHNRLKPFRFTLCGFTNITEDHLNVHKTIENYRNCKFKLLDLLVDKNFVVVNGDDDNCKMIDRGNVYTFGFNSDNYCVIKNVKELSKNVHFDLWIKNKMYKLVSPFCGKYNIYNVTMAFLICMLRGVDTEYLIKKIRSLSIVSGRREYLDFGQDFDIILDYAHTYNGIKCLLESVKNYKKIIVVTGAAGGREKEKRPKIGNLILDKSDIAIFTMDDPRYESVDQIIDEMVSTSDKDYIRIINREEAIAKAFELADNESVVLIIGKGRDNYMAIEDKKIPYSDFDAIEKYFINE